MHSAQDLFNLLDEHTIAYQLHHHPAISTVQEGKALFESIDGDHSKNLFLKDTQGRFLLVSVLASKRVDLKKFAHLIGVGRLSFASPEELLSLLGVVPGSVTPYGLINDEKRVVHFYLDQDFTESTQINFHPLRNDMTLTIATPDFFKACNILQHPPIVVEIPTL